MLGQERMLWTRDIISNGTTKTMMGLGSQGKTRWERMLVERVMDGILGLCIKSEIYLPYNCFLMMRAAFCVFQRRQNWNHEFWLQLSFTNNTKLPPLQSRKEL